MSQMRTPMQTSTIALRPTKKLLTGLLNGYLSGGPGRALASHLATAPTPQEKVLLKRRIALELYARRVIAQARGRSENAAVARAFTTRDTSIREVHYQVLHGPGMLLIESSHVKRSALRKDRTKAWDHLTPCGLMPVAAGPAQDLPPTTHLAVNSQQQASMGAGVVIGVLTSGVDATHPELAGKIAAFRAFDASGVVTRTRPFDTSYHGTRICGIIAGKTAGYAPSITLVVASVFAPRPDDPHNIQGTYAQIAAGMNWLMTGSFGRGGQQPIPGVDLITASLDGISNDPVYLPLFDAALNDHGILPVTAPCVTGVAALLPQQNPQLQGKPNQLRAALLAQAHASATLTSERNSGRNKARPA